MDEFVFIFAHMYVCHGHSLVSPEEGFLLFNSITTILCLFFLYNFIFRLTFSFAVYNEVTYYLVTVQYLLSYEPKCIKNHLR